MPIEVRRRPYSYSFSGNPVYYQLYSALAAGDATVFFEVKVLFKKISDSDYSEIVTLPYVPTAGYADIDIKGILNSILEFETPSFPVDEFTPVEAPKQTGNYYIQFREITASSTDPGWDDSELDYACIIVKGGISYFKWRGNNFFVNYLDTTKAFLTWQQRGRMASITERMYLLWLNTSTTLSEFVIKASCKIFYTDGTFVLIITPAPWAAATGNVYYIPAGATQWGSAVIDPGKTIWYWEVGVYDYTNEDVPVAISELFRYYADNRNDYNDETLHYRGSLGGLDSVRVRGVIKFDLTYEFAEQDQVAGPDYYLGNSITPRRTVANSRERRVSKGDIGYLNKEEQDRFRDAHLLREVWQEKTKKWWPVSLITETQTQKTTDDKVWSFPIVYAPAIEGEEYYTPESVDVGTGAFTDNVCLAYLSDFVIGIEDGSPGNKQITANATEQDPQLASEEFRYRVLKQSDSTVVINWTTVTYGDLPLVFELPQDDVYTLEYQSICSNNVFGRKYVMSIDTTGESGGPLPNSVLNNNTTHGSTYNVKLNGVSLKSGSMMASETGIRFDAADTTGAVITVELTFNPSHATIFSGSSHMDGVISANVVTFSGFDFASGFVINLF
jgi:hypothetical protein